MREISLRNGPSRMIRSAGRAALVGLTLYACDGAEDLERIDSVGSFERVVLTPGALRGRFPPRPDDVESDTLIEGAFGLAVDETSVFVLDQTAARVLHLDLDGRLRARIGGAGQGPGELSNPLSVAIGPDGGVWVADPGASRLSRYRPDGTPVDDHRMPYPVVNFAVLEHGPVFPTLSALTLLGYAADGGGITELAVPGERVPTRISRGPEDRVRPHVLRLARLPGGDVAVLQNRHGTQYALWRVSVSGDGQAIVDVRRLPLPGWLATILAEETARIRAETSAEFATGDFLVPFKGMHAIGGDLWLAPAPSASALAVSIPLERGTPVSVVVAGGDVVRGAIDAAVVADRLVVLYRTEVRVYELEPAPDDLFRIRGEGG